MIAEALQGGASASSGDRAGLAAAGSVIAAALSSACCWLPLVFIAAGLSAGGISLAFAPLRPWLIVLAVVALSYGVWSTERQARASDACACAPVPRRRHILNRFTLAISALGVVAFALFPQYVDAVFGERPPVTSSRAAKQVTLRVEGMTCSGCETGIETALRRLPGVVLADASYGDGTVLVGLSPDATFGTDALIQAIAQAGYSVDSLESTPPREKANTRSSSVQVLGDDLEPLVASFNVASKQFRFLAILSPT
jgi:copper chaperone CopZ